jgi:acyl-CoA dehydrogenase
MGQKRLGPGRIFHSMRWLGQAQRAFELMCDRALNRYAHGSMLADRGAIQTMIAESAAEIQAARLMTLDAARVMNSGSEARVEISLTKLHGAKMLHNVIDRAIQVHGALGVTGDTPLDRMYREARYASTTGPTRCITSWWQGACSGTTRIVRRGREVARRQTISDRARPRPREAPLSGE